MVGSYSTAVTSRGRTVLDPIFCDRRFLYELPYCGEIIVVNDVKLVLIPIRIRIFILMPIQILL
jgi:hypothetical protein